MIDAFSFFSLSDLNVRTVVLGSVLLGATAGAMGSFALLRQRALIGDALAHAALPGVVLGFVFAGGKLPPALLLGAGITAGLGALAVNALVRHSKLKEDTATATVLSVFFALGIVALTIVQKQGAASQSGLSHFLFGNAAALVTGDVIRFALLAAVTAMILLLFYKEFKVMAFDGTYTRTLGLPAGLLDFVMTTLIVVAVVMGLQAVGVVLMAAMLITPAAAARLWTERLSGMILLSALLGAVSGVLGAFISSLAPQMPTGPWMVLAVSFVFGLSLLFAPRRGVVARLLRFVALRRKTLYEHILKTFYHLSEQRAEINSKVTASDLARARFFSGNTLQRGLAALRRQGLVRQERGEYSLTERGWAEAGRIVRLHRLWELYLSEYMQLPADHVHRDAEEMEHILTPELEAQLEALLERPHVDPHGEPIPPRTVISEGRA